MKILLEFLFMHLLDHPEELVIEEEKDQIGFKYLVKVHPDDMGRIIGRQGNVINAIRTIVQLKGSKEGVRVKINVVEKEDLASTTNNQEDRIAE